MVICMDMQYIVWERSIIMEMSGVKIWSCIHFISLDVQNIFHVNQLSLLLCHFVCRQLIYDNYCQVVLLTWDYCHTDTSIGWYMGYHIPNGDHLISQLDMKIKVCPITVSCRPALLSLICYSGSKSYHLLYCEMYT